MYVREQEREIELMGHYDVVVCGAGPAGIAAALSAAGQGLRTILLDAGGCLGGIWTSGCLSVILDVEGKGGILALIKARLTALSAVLPRGNQVNFVYDVEALKVLLEDLCTEAGIEVLLHTRVVAVAKEGSSIQAVLTESSQGRMGIAGKIFIDCTGNGDLAAQAGCAFELGHPETGSIQPASMLAIVSGVPEAFTQMQTYEKKREFNDFLDTYGIVPSNKAPTIIELPWAGLCILSVNHQFRVHSDKILDITKATIQARKEINTIVQRLRDEAGWSQLRLVTTPAHIGLREGRRIQGDYMLGLADITSGQAFGDGVCLVKFKVDIHAMEPGQSHGYGNGGVVTQPYQIPYRSLIAAGLDNLGLAGRCISGDFFAHASYRVTSNAVATGEAIGFAAAGAIAGGNRFRAVPGEEVSLEMSKRGYLL
ncbi:FAD-dependent oxidoreductase [Paenibacillus agricola]|uniref:FAD-dependent oxidoreductase n=1 Tax=Paenibacillus agricola TaxID=2716264 RepID=A0ABX0J6J9_9BACL|nr:FAD-dependent oxidoreductase [Paenibacillus agricola]NHN29709.1 FAD-dependent oxidoreductase [Paenibacillus agricola]